MVTFYGYSLSLYNSMIQAHNFTGRLMPRAYFCGPFPKPNIEEWDKDVKFLLCLICMYHCLRNEQKCKHLGNGQTKWDIQAVLKIFSLVFLTINIYFYETLHGIYWLSLCQAMTFWFLFNFQGQHNRSGNLHTRVSQANGTERCRWRTDYQYKQVKGVNSKVWFLWFSSIQANNRYKQVIWITVNLMESLLVIMYLKQRRRLIHGRFTKHWCL